MAIATHTVTLVVLLCMLSASPHRSPAWCLASTPSFAPVLQMGQLFALPVRGPGCERRVHVCLQLRSGEEEGEDAGWKNGNSEDVHHQRNQRSAETKQPLLKGTTTRSRNFLDSIESGYDYVADEFSEHGQQDKLYMDADSVIELSSFRKPADGLSSHLNNAESASDGSNAGVGSQEDVGSGGSASGDNSAVQGSGEPDKTPTIRSRHPRDPPTTTESREVFKRLTQRPERSPASVYDERPRWHVPQSESSEERGRRAPADETRWLHRRAHMDSISSEHTVGGRIGFDNVGSVKRKWVTKKRSELDAVAKNGLSVSYGVVPRSAEGRRAQTNAQQAERLAQMVGELKESRQTDPVAKLAQELLPAALAELHIDNSQPMGTTEGERRGQSRAIIRMPGSEDTASRD